MAFTATTNKEASKYMIPTYVEDYIRRALNGQDDLECFDASQAGRYTNVVELLYYTYQGGGIPAARRIWQNQITSFHPELAHIQVNGNGNGSGDGDDDGDGDGDQPDGPDEPEWKPDDDALALEIAEAWGNQIAFFHGEWHGYEESYWQQRPQQEVHLDIRKFLRHKRRYGVKVSQSRIKALASMLEDDLFVSDRTINKTAAERKQYIPLQNGLFNVDKMQLEPHRPDLYFYHQLSFPYDPVADCPNWKRFLNTSLVIPGTTAEDFDMIAFLQEALAYSMTARTDMKASFWLYGKPDSGKSTLLSLIRSLMGDLHATVDMNGLGANKFMLSAIVGKRVVTFSEADQGAVLPDGLYKALVGGSDEIFADVKNKPGITFKPEAKLWWAMNNAPRTTDRSGATVNRLKPILFNRSIPKHERIQNLDAILASELSGIFNWLLAGYRRLVENRKFTEVAQAEAWKQAYTEENDTELTFFNECLESDPNSSIQSSMLYKEYRHWCEDNGFRAKNINQVAKDWERLGLEKFLKKGRKFWRGVKFDSE